MTGDRFSPIVVKEIRQGLKSRSFLLFFVGLQVAMVLSMFTYITSVVSENARMEGADVFFWSIIGTLLLLLLPLRAFQALHDEIKQNTLELIFLTRLTAWKITWGKWVAHAIQVVLMVSAVLPYFVLRYFLGAIDIPRNLLTLAVILCVSLTLTAMGVGLSSVQSKIIRTLILLCAVMGGGWSLINGGISPFGSPSAGDYAILFLGAAGVLFFFLEHGASKIAPPAENHAGRKRALGLFLLLLACAYAIIEEEVASVILTTVVLGPFLCGGAINETMPRVPSAFRGWKPAAALNWLFLPGWPSGFLYSLAVFTLLALTAIGVENYSEISRFYLSLFNAFLAPYVIVCAVPRLHPHRLPAYLSLQVAGIISAVMIMVVRDMRLISDESVGFLGVILPVLGLFQFESTRVWQPNFPLHLIMAGGVLSLALVFTIPALRQIAHLRRALRHENDA